MKVVPVFFPSPSGKKELRYMAVIAEKGVHIQVFGYYRWQAIEKALKAFFREDID
jgi:hypothetical protein